MSHSPQFHSFLVTISSCSLGHLSSLAL
uniref:Uncharacterized protein n=1 Tax=Arundo donax TaxID=35708 RepID=A0A0A8Y3W6_ARUDO